MRIILSFVTGLLIARYLGPDGFGHYSFLLGSFASFVMLTDMGTSSAFFTFLSKKQRGPKYFLYYLNWIYIQFFGILFLIALILPHSIHNKIWMGHSKGLVILAFLASFAMRELWNQASHVGESIRATAVVQAYTILLSIVYLISVIIMIATKTMTLANIFIVIFIIHMTFIYLLFDKIRRKIFSEQDELFMEIFNEFKVYCKPLVVYGIVSAAYTFADVWFLQKFGGPVQQGYYAIGLRFSTICLLATTSMLKVFWKEIAEAKEKQDKQRMFLLYSKTSQILYLMSALGSCLVIPHSRDILLTFLGTSYEMGWVCLAIMFYYPVQQSLGQINGSFFYATEQTKLHTQISIGVMLVSIPVTYFTLAPSTAFIPGLGLGSVGLALKTVILSMVSVNLLIYFACKKADWPYRYSYQIKVVLVLFILSYGVKSVVGVIIGHIGLANNLIAAMAISAPFYLALSIGIFYRFPEIADLEKKDIEGFFAIFKKTA